VNREPRLAINLKNQTAKAFAWSTLLSVTTKLVSLVLFLAMARLLAPAEVGMAQSVLLLIALVGMLSEQSLHAALVQQPQLERDDVNLPFWISFGTACLLSVGMLVFAPQISAAVGKEPIDNLIRIASVVPPVVAANGILIALMRRAMNFREIAQTTVVAGLVSGAIAVTFALMGHGALSIVVQAILAPILLGLMIWHKPHWRPGRRLITERTKSIWSFSSATFASLFVDFFSNRLIDFMILKRFGFSELGIFAVGVKIFQATMEAAAGAILDVAFSAFSRISSEASRLREAYERLLFLLSSLVAPIFVGISALAPEISATVFGERWAGSAQVLAAFGAMGAMQLLVMFNHLVLSSRGYPRLVLRFCLLRLTVGAAVLGLYPADTMGELVVAYVVSQILVAPYTFYLVLGVTQVSVSGMLRPLVPGLLAAAIAHTIVGVARGMLAEFAWPTILLALLLSVLFVVCHFALLILVSGSRLREQVAYAVDSFPALRRFQPLLRP
jgi:O-antigen/teichoic acid export membrane protein